MIEISIEPDHPIVFVYDTENTDMEIPVYVARKLIASNDSCVSIGVQASGPTKIIVSNIADTPIGALVFAGDVETPSGTISVNTSEREGWITADVGAYRARVRIWVNDQSEPSIVTIEAAGAVDQTVNYCA